MTTLYRPVLIETAEQARALPRSTPYTVVAPAPGGVVYAGLVGDRQPEFLVSVAGGPQHFALMPIEAEEETRHGLVGLIDPTAPHDERRLVTPWEEA